MQSPRREESSPKAAEEAGNAPSTKLLVHHPPAPPAFPAPSLDSGGEAWSKRPSAAPWSGRAGEGRGAHSKLFPGILGSERGKIQPRNGGVNAKAPGEPQAELRGDEHRNIQP